MFQQEISSEVWRDYWKVENTYCLDMGSTFNYKHPHGSWQPSVARVIEDLTPSSTYEGTKQILIHIFSQNPHTLNI